MIVSWKKNITNNDKIGGENKVKRIP